MILTLSLLALAASSAGTADYQSTLDRLRLAQDVPGVSAVVSRQDTVLFSGASGMADIKEQRPMTADTRLYAGSLTKLFTAVAALRLVEDRRLALDDTVPEVGAGLSATVTAGNLLTHASGLDREGNFEYWFTGHFPDKTALGRYLRNVKLRIPPGGEVHYSNIGYAALGAVIERITGQSYGRALKTLVFGPLAMSSSGAPGPAAGIAVGYTPVDRLLPSTERPFAGVGDRVGNRNIREYHDAKAMTPAFGAYTSANDLGRLARFLIGYGGNDVLSRKMRKRMGTRQDSGWGLGLRISTIDGRPVARHEGWFAAHRSHLLLDMRSGISVVVLTNSDSATPANIAEALNGQALVSIGAENSKK